MSDDGIIKNQLKIESAIHNALAFIKVQEEFGSFDKYIWKFVNYQSIINNFEVYSQIPSKTRESDAMSRDLKKRGFTFLGSTICYSFMQAAGMVNDHEIHCFRYNTCIVEQEMHK